MKIQLGTFSHHTHFFSAPWTVEVIDFPTLNGVTPLHGTTDGGLPLQMSADFQGKATFLTCQMSTTSTISVRLLSSNVLECITPARHAGHAKVFISSGTAMLSRPFSFTYKNAFVLDLSRKQKLDGSSKNSSLIRTSMHAPTDVVKHARSDLINPEYGIQHRRRRIAGSITLLSRSSIGASGGIMTVAGKGFSPEDALALSVTSSQYISSAVIMLEVAAGVAGEYISYFEGELQEGAQVRALYELEPQVTVVQPPHGSIKGGSILVFGGKGFVDSQGLSCVIGTICPVFARWSSSYSIECVSPAHADGVVPVSATNGSPSVDKSQVYYHYRALEMHLGGYVRQLELLQTGPDESRYLGCAAKSPAETVDNLKSHGDYTLFEFSFSVVTSSCGNSLDEVGFDAVFLGSHVDVQYHYLLIPTVRSIVPQYAESGLSQPFQILGKHFSAAMSVCLSDDGVMFGGTIISSAMLSCELRGHTDGDVSFGVGRHKGNGQAGVVTYFTETPIKDISPSIGPEAGGTLVSIFALSARAPPPLLCRFGTIGPVAARHKSAGAFQCLTPSIPPGTYQFSASLPSAANVVGVGLYFTFMISPGHLLALRLSDSHQHPALTLHSSDACVRWSPMCGLLSAHDECAAGIFVQSVYSVGFQTFSICKQFSVDFEFTAEPSIAHVFPGLMAINSPHTFSVYGQDFDQRSANMVFVGQGVPCHFQSSCMLTCTTPRITVLPSSGSRTQHVPLKYTDLSLQLSEVMMHSLHRTNGTSDGGTVVRVSGTFHAGASDVTCRFGSITSISAMSVAIDGLECAAPSRMVGTVDFGVGLLGDGYVPNSLHFKFTSPCPIHAFTPSRGFSSIQTDLALYPDNCISRATHSCVGLQQGVVSVGLMANPINCFASGGSLGCGSWREIFNADSHSADLSFDYAPTAHVDSLQPQVAMRGGGTVITLIGANFASRGNGCVFGCSFVEGHLVSSTIFVCVSPSMPPLASSDIVTHTSARWPNALATLELDILPPVNILELSPRFGTTEGGSITSLSVSRTIPASANAHVRIGSVRPVAARLNEKKLIEYISPARAPGRALVQLHFSLCRFGDSGEVFEHVPWLDERISSRAICRQAGRESLQRIGMRCSDFTSAMKNITDEKSTGSITLLSRSSIGASGGIMTVAGKGFSPEDALALSVTSSQYISSAVIMLEVAAGVAGEYISYFEGELQEGAQVRALYELEPQVTVVQPPHGSIKGGSILVFGGKGFVDSQGLSCVIGTICPVFARWSSSYSIECVSPAHADGVVPVSATNGSPSVDKSQVYYHYRALEMHLGGYVRQLELLQTGPDESRYLGCAAKSPAETVDNLKSHGDYTLFEFSFSVVTSSCGNSLDEVGFDAVFLGSHVDVQYHYLLIPTVRSIVPQYAESGLSQPFQILGKHFSAAMSVCLSDDGVMFGGTIISSAMLSCELRGHTDGDVSFGVGRHKGNGQAGVVTYFTETPIKDISPSIGPEAGGTLVSIFALSARAPPPLLCRFGTIGPVAARHKSAEEFECTSSARRFGSVPFALSVSSRFAGSHPSFSFSFVSWLHDPDMLVLSDSSITKCMSFNTLSIFIYLPPSVYSCTVFAFFLRLSPVVLFLQVHNRI